jgi:hypothetical protein
LWHIFVEIIEKVHIVGTLPSGDGLRGEGYIKLSDFVILVSVTT